MTRGSLLVLGTSSGAGKTTVVTGLCRLLARQGISVAPFKAQNMSLNSFVTRNGEEIGRAQATQAQAANVEPEAAMNPVLLKPGTDTRSHLVVLGHPAGEIDGAQGWAAKGALLGLVVDAYRDLKRRFDVVLCEGAGSPAEVNLREHDIVNLGFARAGDVPAIVIGDIDPGGVFAALTGTLALLAPSDQDLVHGFIINRFRGDRSLLQQGLEMLKDLTGRPTYGVLPFLPGLGIDAEDALDPTLYLDTASPLGAEVLRVGVVRLPRASNLTDLDPFAVEPGVVVRFITRPEEMADADLVVIPGSRATVSDLLWMRQRGFGEALVVRAASGLPILGICGGLQMLGQQIVDLVESSRGTVDGFGLLPVRTTFAPEKVLARPERVLADGCSVRGYEIHHGRVTILDGPPFFADQGCRNGEVVGTTWHGLFESDNFRRAFLIEIAAASGRDFRPSEVVNFEAIREARIDDLADLLDAHLDLPALIEVLEGRDRRPPRLNLSFDAAGR